LDFSFFVGDVISRVGLKLFGPGNLALDQLCPTHSPFQGFMRPSLGFRCSKSILHTENLSLFW